MIDVFCKPHLARRIPPVLQFVGRRWPVTIARDADEVETGVKIYLAGEVCEEDGRTFEHPDKQDGLTGKVVLDLCGQFLYFFRNLVARDEYLQVRHGATS